MSRSVLVEVHVPEELEGFRMPASLDERRRALVDRQAAGHVLTHSEQEEVRALVDLSHTLSLLRRRMKAAGSRQVRLKALARDYTEGRADARELLADFEPPSL